MPVEKPERDIGKSSLSNDNMGSLIRSVEYKGKGQSALCVCGRSHFSLDLDKAPQNVISSWPKHEGKVLDDSHTLGEEFIFAAVL